MTKKNIEPSSAIVGYETFRRWVIATATIVLVLIALLLSWKVNTANNEMQATAVMKTQTFVTAMEAQVAYSINFTQLSLSSFANALRTLPDDAIERTDAVQRMLSAPGVEFSSEFWMLFIDKDGIGVAASNNYAVKGVSYRDRDYFQAHIDGKYGDDFYIGEPDLGRVSKRRNFFLSKRIVNADGVFVGVLAAPIDASRYAAFFDTARFTDDLTVTLIHRQGKVIARHPKFEESFSKDISNSTLFRQLPSLTTGTYLTEKSAIDAEPRLISYRAFDKLPLIITVGISADVWTSAFKKDIVPASTYFAGIFLLVASGAYGALRSYRQLDSSNTQQRRLVDEVRATEQKLYESEKLIRTVTDHIPATVSYIDLDQRIVFSNSFKKKNESHPLDQSISCTLGQIYDEITYRLHQEHFDIAKAGATTAFDFEEVKDGRARHLNATYIPQFDDYGKVIGVCSMINDVTSQKAIEKELIKLARFDFLTGLPNRSQLLQRLQETVARAGRTQALVAVLFLDIDDFKQINDTFGHHTGDIVLKEFSGRLLSVVRTTDMVARLAGDEFVILLEGLNQHSQILEVASKIERAMRTPFHIQGSQRTISASIGAAAFTHAKHHDPSTILRKADEAMYLAKQERGSAARVIYI